MSQPKEPAGFGAPGNPVPANSPPCRIRSIVKRNGNIVTYDRRRIVTAIFKATHSTGHPNLELAERMAEKVEAALVQTYEEGVLPSVEDIQDLVERTLIDHRLTRVARNYIVYRHERAMARAEKSYSFEVSDNIPYKKIYEVLLWNMAHRCESVEALNALIQGGGFPDLVRATDRRYEDELDTAARRMLEQRDALRLVIVAGPSSSGKTTTMLKLADRLRAAGLRLKAINVDHYFFDLVQHPRDEFGDYDYEAPESLDLALINRHLEQLVAGAVIRTPHYDFRTGKRTLDVHEVKLEPGEWLLLDSLHGLYSPMTVAIPAPAKLRLYVETLGQFRAADGAFMRWADHRLLRRMVRDRDQRNSQPIETINHWHYVRRSELKYIIPFIKDADFVLNTALPYELPILKHRLSHYLAPAIELFRADPHKQDAFVRANRVCHLLAPLTEVADESCIPPNSLLREFIGGSGYAY